MDPHLRWLRRLVIARAIERLAVEATVVGAATGGAVSWFDGDPARVGLSVAAAIVSYVALRLGLAVATNPVNHRYLLRWTDPTAHLSVTTDPEVQPDRSEATDPIGHELRTGGFRYVARLERSDAGEDGHAVLDLYQAEAGRLIVGHGGDGELTVLSRLDDGRGLVTTQGLIPPTEEYLVQRASGGPDHGQAATDILIGHVQHLLTLRADGIEAVATDPDDVIALLRTEWEAWQELGPFIGPLISVRSGGTGRRRRLRFRFSIEVPQDLVLDRAGGRSPSLRASRTRSRPASG